MRKIIDRKLYDTEKSDEIASWTNGLGLSDFAYQAWTIYRTKKNAFFILHEGGPKTAYARAVGNTREYGEYIETIDDDKLLEFLRNYDQVDTIMELFPDKITEA